MLPGPGFRRFEPTLFEFLENSRTTMNNRPWFQANKWRYERNVSEPCLAFITTFQPRLRKISRHFLASDPRMGGSLLRVYRDTRFSGGRERYKTNAGIQFRHEAARTSTAPASMSILRRTSASWRSAHGVPIPIRSAGFGKRFSNGPIVGGERETTRSSVSASTWRVEA